MMMMFWSTSNIEMSFGDVLTITNKMKLIFSYEIIYKYMSLEIKPD
uniref:Uncharacterized protein n=1 Tax=Lepeophtheirus salmonis TaxID=72036 RepID=A0A0K2ULU9_LEPSM